MSRHVTKCMKKIYCTGFDGSAVVPHNRKVNLNRVADGGGTSLPVAKKQGHRILSDKARKERKKSCEQRAASMLAILAGEGRQALVDMFLASSI